MERAFGEKGTMLEVINYKQPRTELLFLDALNSKDYFSQTIELITNFFSDTFTITGQTLLHFRKYSEWAGNLKSTTSCLGPYAEILNFRITQIFYIIAERIWVPKKSCPHWLSWSNWIVPLFFLPIFIKRLLYAKILKHFFRAHFMHSQYGWLGKLLYIKVRPPGGRWASFYIR